MNIEFKEYDAQLYQDVDCHIMDGDVLWGLGFSYRDNPISAINEGKKNIVFLAHPSHWYKVGELRI